MANRHWLVLCVQCGFVSGDGDESEARLQAQRHSDSWPGHQVRVVEQMLEGQ